MGGCKDAFLYHFLCTSGSCTGICQGKIEPRLIFLVIAKLFYFYLFNKVRRKQGTQIFMRTRWKLAHEIRCCCSAKPDTEKERIPLSGWLNHIFSHWWKSKVKTKEDVVGAWSDLRQKANDSSVLHTSKEFQYSETERTFPKLASTSGIKALDSLKWITKAASPKMWVSSREGPCKPTEVKNWRETFHF